MNSKDTRSTMETLIEGIQETGKKNEVSEALKELFDKQKLNMITDLSGDEIRLITRIVTIAKIRKIDSWKEAIILYMELQISKKRSSRKEMLKAIGGYISNNSFWERGNNNIQGNRRDQF